MMTERVKELGRFFIPFDEEHREERESLEASFAKCEWIDLDRYGMPGRRGIIVGLDHYVDAIKALSKTTVRVELQPLEGYLDPRLSG